MRKLLTCGLMLVISVPAYSQVVYSNVDFTAGPFQGGTMGLAATNAGNAISRVRADDITPVSGGQWVSQFTFSMANFNAATVSARPLVRFWASDGAGSGPGTFLAGFNFNAVTLAANNFTLLTATLASGQFLMPTTLFWAGIQFDNNTGATGATQAQIANMGWMIRNPPTVGSSSDVVARFNTAVDSAGVNNPAQTFANFGGVPVANFAWEFVVAPEPTSCILVAGLGFIGLQTVRNLRKRMKVAA